MATEVALANQSTYDYCHACGEQVMTYAVRGGEAVELRCSFCGLPVGRQSSQAEGRLECVLLADDEEFLRWGLSDLLLQNKLAVAVVTCGSGAELVTKFVERLRKDQETPLVILDILMKNMDGVAAARALRAVEQGFGVSRPVPIVFLSALRPDTALRNFVARVQPALFLNKGVDNKPDRLAVRLRQMIDYLSRLRTGETAKAPSS